MAKSIFRRSARSNSHNLLQVGVLSNGKDIRLFFDFEIGEKEYNGIGWAMVQWAFLEEVLYKRTALLARRARLKIPNEAHGVNFKHRL
jgi:hypothetical protein